MGRELVLPVAAFFVLVVLLIFYGYGQNIPANKTLSEDESLRLGFGGDNAILTAKSDISGSVEEMTWYYGGLPVYLEWGDACLGGAGSSQSFSLAEGKSLELPVIRQNIDKQEVLFHGEYIVPEVVVQQFTIRVANKVNTVSKKY